MLSSEKVQLLQDFLGALPESAAVRLAKAIEVDRLTGGNLPHELILNGLRNALRACGNAQRTPSPLRLFCRPLEDLLIDGARKEKQRGRILRSSVLPVWHWLSETVIPDQVTTYIDEVKGSVLGYKYEEAQACAAQFWPIAGEALRNAIAADRKAARLALNGELAVADAEEIALLLLAGPSVLDIQALMVKPVPAMTEQLLWQLRHIYDEVIASAADAAPYVPVVAMYRLEKPWEALKLALLITHQTQDTLISSTDMGLVGDILFAELEDHRIAIHAVRHPNFDVDALLENLADFTDISSAIVKEVEILRRGKWGQRLLKDRAAVGAVMDGFMERAPKEIGAALATQRTGFTGMSRVADFSKPVSEDKIERALRYARLMTGSRRLAAAASFGAKLADAMDEAMQILRSYNEDVVKELRTADSARRAVAERQFQLAVELTAMLFSDEEAEFLRRRGKAATASAVAA